MVVFTQQNLSTPSQVTHGVLCCAVLCCALQVSLGLVLAVVLPQSCLPTANTSGTQETGGRHSHGEGGG